MASSRISLTVTPRASRTRVETGNSGVLRAYVTAAPVDGEANKAVIELISDFLGIAKSKITVVQGNSSRKKTLEITGIDQRTIEEYLKEKTK